MPSIVDCVETETLSWLVAARVTIRRTRVVAPAMKREQWTAWWNCKRREDTMMIRHAILRRTHYGSLRSLEFTPDADGRYRAIEGHSFIAAVRFSTPVQARVLLTYGNASQPGSPHNRDQLRLYAHNQLHTAWLTRAGIQAHLSLREEV
jgi:acyl-homoserine-lactone acylase